MKKLISLSLALVVSGCAGPRYDYSQTAYYPSPSAQMLAVGQTLLGAPVTYAEPIQPTLTVCRQYGNRQSCQQY